MREAITIRRSTDADRVALDRLAELDSRRSPQGQALLAFANGELAAARTIDGDTTVADPFRPTSEIVALLELRVAQERRERRRQGFALLRPSVATLWSERRAV